MKKENTELRLLRTNNGIELINVYYDDADSKVIYGITDPLEMVADSKDELQDILLKSLAAFYLPALTDDDLKNKSPKID